MDSVAETGANETESIRKPTDEDINQTNSSQNVIESDEKASATINDNNIADIVSSDQQIHETYSDAPNTDDPTNMSVDQLRRLYSEKNAQIKQLKELVDQNDSKRKLDQLSEVKSNYEKKLKQQQLESSRKENILIMRLTLKEQELQECLTQIETLKQLRVPNNTQLESYLLDPALNYMFEQMKKEVDVAKSRVDEMQSELNAWKFSADSVTGKRLMAKCRQLHQENEELGKMISSGKIAKLEGGLAMHVKYSEDLKKSQSEIEEVLMEMEEDIEGFQNTVYYLQQQLKEQKEKNAQLEESLTKYKSENTAPESISTGNDNL